MGTGELDERRPAAERERALAYGAEFRLGSLERVSRGRQMHRYTGLGIVFGGFVLAAGLPTLIGIDAGPYAGSTGTRLPGLRGHRRELRDLVAEAVRQLAPRLVPALTEAYESGGTVSFGRVLVSQQGITLSAWYPPGDLVPWAQVKSVHMTYINPKHGDYVHEIVVGRKGRETEEIRVGGLPNGIFLAALLHYAAGQHGVMVTGYHGDGGGIPA